MAAFRLCPITSVTSASLEALLSSTPGLAGLSSRNRRPLSGPSVCSVASIRRMPVGWFTKVEWLQRVSPQLTWAQGTHSLALIRDVASSLRAQVVRALLDVDHYSATPHVVFALLAPPSLVPECAMSVQCPSHAQSAAEQLAAPQPFDGHFARAQQLRDSPVFGPIAQTLVQSRPLPPDWQHALRKRWCKQCWQLVQRDRSQDYAGIGRGANRILTVSLIQQWFKEADELQYMIDMGSTTELDSTLDPRPRLKILRLLLTGGLMAIINRRVVGTPSRV